MPCCSLNSSGRGFHAERVEAARLVNTVSSSPSSERPHKITTAHVKILAAGESPPRGLQRRAER